MSLKMYIEQLNKYYLPISILVCFLLDLIFISFSLWPLTILAAIIGGLFCTEMKWGSLAGILGILLAWLTSYLLATNDIIQQADQLGRLIIGSSGAGGILVFIIFLVGALMGFLGGSIGSGIRMLTIPESGDPQDNDQID
ncbi:MAG: hypothetical protein ACXAC6_01540 [Candidatus Hodarchaeales archaeon]|jgi:hypothetical protein